MTTKPKTQPKGRYRDRSRRPRPPKAARQQARVQPTRRPVETEMQEAQRVLREKMARITATVERQTAGREVTQAEVERLLAEATAEENRREAPFVGTGDRPAPAGSVVH